MSNIKISNVLNIQNLFLNNINPTLTSHSTEVAYISYRLSRALNFDKNRTLNLILASLLHDIGAFRTNDLYELSKFSDVNTLTHCIYGYLFLKKCPSLTHLAPLVLYHHHKENEKHNCIKGDSYPVDAGIIFIADRLSVLCHSCNYNKDDILRVLEDCDYNLFNKKHFDLITELIVKWNLLEGLRKNTYKKELDKFIKNSIDFDIDFKSQAIFFPLVIDFVNPDAAMNTIVALSISSYICNKLKIDISTTEDILLSSCLQDIGKLCTTVDLSIPNRSLNQLEQVALDNYYDKIIYSLNDSGISKDVIDNLYNHYKHNTPLDNISSKILFISHSISNGIDDSCSVEDIKELLLNQIKNISLPNCSILKMLPIHIDELSSEVFSDIQRYINLINNIDSLANDIICEFEDTWVIK